MLDKEAKPDKRKISVQSKIIKITSLAAVAALAAGISGKLYYDSSYYKDENISISNMKYAGSYEEIYEYLKLNELVKYDVMSDDYDAVAEGAVEEEIFSDSDKGYADGIEGGIVGEVSNGTDGNSVPTSPNMEKNYTETYNQEEGVNEADIVKTDGSNIYYCSDGSIRTAKVDNGKFISSDVIAEDIGSINQMYLYDDKLIVISSENDYTDCKTLVTFYSKGSNKLIGQYSQDGYFQDIRLMDDGYMYLISEDVNYDFHYEGIEPKDTEKYIPSYVSDGEEIYLECDDILLSSCHDEYNSSFINLVSFDVNSDSPCQPVDVKAVAGTSGDVYCSQQNLYIAYGWDNTEITRFMIDKGKIIPKAGTSVRGYIKDQFSMSEYNGYFR
ncbi:MAG: beta-propeller domain-containing protein, partial [Oscillospiraceae bacterium]|nr:beta-propeller domain-containing protein [Oscillospiraceae bacterium]